MQDMVYSIIMAEPNSETVTSDNAVWAFSTINTKATTDKMAPIP